MTKQPNPNPGPAEPVDPQGSEGAMRRVVVIDDHAMFRSGVKYDIGSYVSIVGRARTWRASR